MKKAYMTTIVTNDVIPVIGMSGPYTNAIYEDSLWEIIARGFTASLHTVDKNRKVILQKKDLYVQGDISAILLSLGYVVGDNYLLTEVKKDESAKGEAIKPVIHTINPEANKEFGLSKLGSGLKVDEEALDSIKLKTEGETIISDTPIVDTVGEPLKADDTVTTPKIETESETANETVLATSTVDTGVAANIQPVRNSKKGNK